MKKNIVEFSIRQIRDGFVYFSICKQELDEDSVVWRASNGITINSDTNPEWNREDDEFYLRGYDKNKDDIELEVSLADFVRIQSAIDEFMEETNREKVKKVNDLDALMSEIKALVVRYIEEKLV